MKRIKSKIWIGLLIATPMIADKLQLIGVDVKGIFPIASHINSDVKSVSTYINGAFKAYKVGLPDGFQQIKNFEGGRGYWIVLKDGSAPIDINVTGDEITLDDINVSTDQSLNLIAFPDLGNNFIQIKDYFDQLGMKLISMSTYVDGAFKAYKYGLPDAFQQIKEIDPKLGYWIKSKSESIDITPPLPPDFNGTKPSTQ